MLKINVLKALHGDCLIITYGDGSNHIIIDGGIGRECYRDLKVFFENIVLNNMKINLVVLTHIDDDHIRGLLKIFEQYQSELSCVEKMFFNYGEFLNEQLKMKEVNSICLEEKTTQISWKQGTKLEKILDEAGVDYKHIVKKVAEYDIAGAHITILSPDIETIRKFNANWEIEKESDTKISFEEDYSIGIQELNQRIFEGNVTLPNRSSIAFLFEFENYRILFFGDAAADIIEDSLQMLGYSEENPLKVDLCKISHHASKHNTSSDLIKMISCSNYIISTNMTSNGRPSKECLSRIIYNTKQPVTFYCNYEIDYRSMFEQEDYETYNMKFIVIDKEGIDMEDLKK